MIHSIFKGDTSIYMKKFFILILFFCLTQRVEAQFKNILLDPGSIDSLAMPVSIAINSDNEQNIVATSYDNVYHTTNGGLSWSKSKFVSRPRVMADPELTVDSKGNFYYLYVDTPETEGSFDNIRIHQSNDEGDTWGESDFVEVDILKDQRHEQAVVDGKGNLYASWTQFDSYGSERQDCQSGIFFSKSSNGKRWSKTTPISQTSGDCRKNMMNASMPAVTSDGAKVFVAWSRMGKIFFDRSFDEGKTWLTNDLTIAERPGSWPLEIPGIKQYSGMPVLVCDNVKKGRLNGALYLVWADQRNGVDDTDIWFMRSMNFGDSWTPPLRINNDAKGKHQFLPWITVDSATGIIYIAYSDRRDYGDQQTDIYVAYSTDGGSNFKNVKISEKPFSASSYFAGSNISASNGIITPIWTSSENGRTSVWTAVIKHEELEKSK